MKSVYRGLATASKEFDESPESLGFRFRLDLAEIVVRRLASKKWTQQRLAEEVGMNAPAITKVIYSASNCTFETAGRIMFALGIRKARIIVVGVSGGQAYGEATAGQAILGGEALKGGFTSEAKDVHQRYKIGASVEENPIVNDAAFSIANARAKAS